MSTHLLWRIRATKLPDIFSFRGLVQRFIKTLTNAMSLDRIFFQR